MQWLIDLISRLFSAFLNRQPALAVEAEKAGAAEAKLATEVQTNDDVAKALEAAAAVRSAGDAAGRVREPGAPDCRDCQA